MRDFAISVSESTLIVESDEALLLRREAPKAGGSVAGICCSRMW